MTFRELPMVTALRARPPGEKRFLVLVPTTGLATAAAAVLTVRLLGFVQRLFWGSAHELVEPALRLSAAHRFLAPLTGGVLVGIVVLLWGSSLRGHGTSSIIEAVVKRGGEIPMLRTLVKEGVTVLTVACGGSLGREGPLVRVGAALGSLFGRRARLTGNRLNILIACGAAAGIAAAYNAPIGGAMFAMEVILGNFALESFGPIVVASAAGTLLSRKLIRNYPAYTPPPHTTLVSGWDLVHYLAMGLLIGAACALFVGCLRGGDALFDRLPLPAWAKPAVGFGFVGLIGVWYPHVFGNGYDTVNQILHNNAPLELLLVLPLLKVVATAATAGSGGSGGLFTPTLFMGSVLGSLYGTAAHAWFPLVTSSPGAYALVGMGAMIAGTTMAPLTAIMTIFELTGDYEILLPLMVVTTAAMIAARLLRTPSIYTATLEERGIHLGARMEELVMDTLRVEDIMRASADPIRETDTVETVLKRLLAEGRKELFVVDDDGRFKGAITLGDLSQHLSDPAAAKTLRAGDVMYLGVPVLSRHDTLSDAIGRWSQLSRDRLPVVDAPATRRFLGELSAGDIIFLYNQEVLHKEARMARFHKARQGERPETTFVELPAEYVVAAVTLPETLQGMTLRDLGARQRFGVNVIEVKRPLPGGRDRRMIPDPGMDLRAGDQLIVVGRPADIAHLGDPARIAEIARSLAAAPSPSPTTAPSS